MGAARVEILDMQENACAQKRHLFIRSYSSALSTMCMCDKMCGVRLVSQLLAPRICFTAQGAIPKKIC